MKQTHDVGESMEGMKAASLYIIAICFVMQTCTGAFGSSSVRDGTVESGARLIANAIDRQTEATKTNAEALQGLDRTLHQLFPAR